MFGRDSQVNELEFRKRLLIGECEVHRAQLAKDWRALAQGVHGLVDHAKSISTFATVGAALVAGWSLFRRPKPTASRPSWPRTILNGVRLVLPVWVALRQRSR